MLVGVMIAMGISFSLLAWRLALGAHQLSAESSVLAGMGGGLITGFAVSLSMLFLQEALKSSQEEAAWRANVTIASSIHGFNPEGHSIEGLNFNGKDLSDANFRGRDLTGYQFRDASLRGADFNNAILKDANFTGADLSTATFSKADLTDAYLLTADLGLADMREVSSLRGAQVNALTCWPPKRLQSSHMGDVRPIKKIDAKGRTVISRGRQGPCPNNAATWPDRLQAVAPAP
ncbi:pentapeptide repeat-containing protein [Streptomyces diastatochromogenes]|uniref:pentapeptide repeat-containing protein n=1 Tax=Streptomyces diastatochromogenes TaxID=42236 RepID=UPI001ABFF3CB|nr:pentapeptide repeat-containing protein [Streptomyces diastatochromogenes]